MEIPFIDARYDVYSTIPIINMYADPSTIAQMVTDLVQAAEWQSFTILYETPEWLPHLSKLLELYDPKGDTVTVKRIDVGLPTKNYRAVLRDVKMSSDVCIIIECSIDSLSEILKQVQSLHNSIKCNKIYVNDFFVVELEQAQQIGLLVDKYQIILTNLDAHTINLEPYQYGGANITTIRMVDATSAPLTEYAEYKKKVAKDDQKEDEKEDGKSDDKASKEEEKPEDKPASEDGAKEAENDAEKKDEGKEGDGGNLLVFFYFTAISKFIFGIVRFFVEFSVDSVRLQTALIHDGIVLLADTFKQLGADHIQPTNLYCMKNESTWEKGLSISNFMRNVNRLNVFSMNGSFGFVHNWAGLFTDCRRRNDKEC